MKKKELKKLCDDHWAYIEQVIRNEYDDPKSTHTKEDIDSYCRRIKLHYTTAMTHGFKHGMQWMKINRGNP